MVIEQLCIFGQSITEDKAEADLLIVIGSSLKVRPVALIPSSLPENVPQVTFCHNLDTRHFESNVVARLILISDPNQPRALAALHI